VRRRQQHARAGGGFEDGSGKGGVCVRAGGGRLVAARVGGGGGGGRGRFKTPAVAAGGGIAVAPLAAAPPAQRHCGAEAIHPPPTTTPTPPPSPTPSALCAAVRRRRRHARAGGGDEGGGGKGVVFVPAPLWLLIVRACGALLVVAATVHDIFNPCWRRWRLSMGCDSLCFGRPSVARDVFVRCMHLLSDGTYELYLCTAARTNPRHLCPVTCSSVELIVSIGQAINWSGLDNRFSQLLPTSNTSSIRLKSEDYGESNKTKTPAALTVAKATSS